MASATQAVDARLAGLAADVANPWWRLSSGALYSITRKPDTLPAPLSSGLQLPTTDIEDAPPDPAMVIPFRPNWAQRMLYFDLHYRNLVLKARQLGITTFWAVFALDRCMFNSNTQAGLIADTLPNATKILRQKVRFAYMRMPIEFRRINPLVVDSATVLEWANGSRLEVGVSLRSDSLHLLHVSEFAKIVTDSPLRAQEVVTGALPTLGQYGLALIESTGRGAEGTFFEWCQEARQLQASGAPLSPLQYRFLFLPWWQHPSYVVSAEHAVIPPPIVEYFRKLRAETGREFSREQVAWYTQTSATLGGLMRREHPSTPDEAFAASDEGIYFSRELLEAREQGRITSVPIDPSYPVHTWWDIGVRDYTSIWFTQTVGREVRCVDYYEAFNERFGHYFEVIRKRAVVGKYRVGRWVGPHDIASRPRMQVAGSGPVLSFREEIQERYGLEFAVVPRAKSVQDEIELMAGFLRTVLIDESRCAVGLQHLSRFGRKWDQVAGKYKNEPADNEHAHAADAFRTLVMGQRRYGQQGGGSDLTAAEMGAGNPWASFV